MVMQNNTLTQDTNVLVYQTVWISHILYSWHMKATDLFITESSYEHKHESTIYSVTVIKDGHVIRQHIIRAPYF